MGISNGNMVWLDIYIIFIWLVNSPRRSRRDGKPTQERVPSSNNNLDTRNQKDQDQKHGLRVQDGGLPLGTPLTTDSKLERGAPSDEVEKKSNDQHEGTKHSSNPSDARRSQSYFQVLCVLLCLNMMKFI